LPISGGSVTMSSRNLRFSPYIAASIASLTCILMHTAQAQTQASCTFHLFTLGSTASSPVIYVHGVNDYGTVVGDADFGKSASPRFRAFIHYSGSGTHYVVPSGATGSSFGGRNDAG